MWGYGIQGYVEIQGYKGGMFYWVGRRGCAAKARGPGNRIQGRSHQALVDHNGVQYSPRNFCMSLNPNP